MSQISNPALPSNPDSPNSIGDQFFNLSIKPNINIIPLILYLLHSMERYYAFSSLQHLSISERNEKFQIQEMRIQNEFCKIIKKKLLNNATNGKVTIAQLYFELLNSPLFSLSQEETTKHVSKFLNDKNIKLDDKNKPPSLAQEHISDIVDSLLKNNSSLERKNLPSRLEDFQIPAVFKNFCLCSLDRSLINDKIAVKHFFEIIHSHIPNFTLSTGKSISVLRNVVKFENSKRNETIPQSLDIDWQNQIALESLQETFSSYLPINELSIDEVNQLLPNIPAHRIAPSSSNSPVDYTPLNKTMTVKLFDEIFIKLHNNINFSEEKKTYIYQKFLIDSLSEILFLNTLDISGDALELSFKKLFSADRSKKLTKDELSFLEEVSHCLDQYFKILNYTSDNKYPFSAFEHSFLAIDDFIKKVRKPLSVCNKDNLLGYAFCFPINLPIDTLKRVFFENVYKCFSSPVRIEGEYKYSDYQNFNSFIHQLQIIFPKKINSEKLIYIISQVNFFRIITTLRNLAKFDSRKIEVAFNEYLHMCQSQETFLTTHSIEGKNIKEALEALAASNRFEKIVPDEISFHQPIATMISVYIEDEMLRRMQDLPNDFFDDSLNHTIIIKNYVKRLLDHENNFNLGSASRLQGDLPSEIFSYELHLIINTLIYIDRWYSSEADFSLFNIIHRVIASAFLISCKSSNDRFFSNHYYSKVFGVSLKELNKLEISFLKSLNFDLYISAETYVKKIHELIHFLEQSLFT